MSRVVGGDMGPLLEHDQLSKEINEGMLECRKLNLCEKLLFFIEVGCCVEVIVTLHMWCFPLQVQSLKASMRHQYTFFPHTSLTLAAISTTLLLNRELLHTQ